MCELRIIPPSVQLSVFCTFALRAVLLHNLPPHLHLFVAAIKRCATRTLCHNRLALLRTLPYYVIHVFGDASTRPHGRVVDVTTSLSIGWFGRVYWHLLLQVRTDWKVTFWRAAARSAMRPHIEAMVRFAKNLSVLSVMNSRILS